MKNHIHKVRTIRWGSQDRYECLDCGKRLRILSGVIVARTVSEVDEYFRKKREAVLAKARAEMGGAA